MVAVIFIIDLLTYKKTSLLIKQNYI